jgi:hypothetical protein
MKIYTLTSIAGSGFAIPPGVVVDYPNNQEAQRMIDAGVARKPTPAELVVAEERAKAASAAKKAEAEATAATEKSVASAKKKAASDAKKADDKKRERPPAAKKSKK